jgi:opacity protein-like surface antigen
MKTIKPAVLFALVVSLTAIASAGYADDQDMPANSAYFVLKGGHYSPSEKYDINNFNGSTTSHLDPKTGLSGEIALGQYSNSELALELGVGYFESKGTPASGPGSTRLKAVPVVVTAKDFMPLGALKPYLEFGVGAYLTKLEASGNTGSFTSKSKTTYGFHAGAGFNIDISDTLFIGLEGRYLWAKADYGGQPIKLNGFMPTINLGYRY